MNAADVPPSATIAGPSIGGCSAIFGYRLVVRDRLRVADCSSCAMVMMLGVQPRRRRGRPRNGAGTTCSAAFVSSWQKKPLLGAISLDLFAVLFGGVVGVAAGVRGPTSCTSTARASACCAPRPAWARPSWRSGSGCGPSSGTRARWMFGGVAVFGVCTITFGLSTSFWLSLVVADRCWRGRHGQRVRAPAARAARDAGCDPRPRERGQFHVHRRVERARRIRAGVQPRWLGIVRAVVLGGLHAHRGRQLS